MEKKTLFSGLGLNQGVVRVFLGGLLRDSEKISKKSFFSPKKVFFSIFKAWL
jgi:hypothetical protein